MRAGSLFSGVGGLDLGLARAGFEHAFFCESDPWRRSVLAAHWPGVPAYEDVRDVCPGDEASWSSGRGAGRRTVGAERRDSPVDAAWPGLGGPSIGGINLLCGGFPCQDLSVAGQRRGLAGDRSGLFFEFARVIDLVRPGWVLVENVPGLLSSNGGRDFGVVLGTLADLGYGVGWRVLDSRFFGVPQRRRRVFIVGAVADGDPRAAAERAGQILAVGTRCPGHPATRGEAGPTTPIASLSGLGTGGPDDNDGQGGRLVANGIVRRYGKGTDSDATDTLIAAPLSHGSNPNSNAAGRRREDDHNLVSSITLASDPIHAENLAQPSTKRNVDPGVVAGASVGVRRLTPVECERLQAWPDHWTNPAGDAPDSRRYAACGDGVTATVAEWVGRRLLAHLSARAEEPT